MTDFPVAPAPRLLIKKSIEQIQYESGNQHLKRTLGPVNLVLLGIGCIIGAGIYVMTGNAAANYAGPAVILSFVVAGLACAFAGLCYAELASSMPVAGSAYTYSYTSLGEVFAWIMGWLLVLEYGVSAATVAAGWSGNGHQPAGELRPADPGGVHHLLHPGQRRPRRRDPVHHGGHGFNLLGAGGILLVTALLVIGISESASVNNVIVVVKVGVLLVFVAMGVFYIHPVKLAPLHPEERAGGLKYGLGGDLPRRVHRSSSPMLGFEAVSTAAAEAKNPAKRHAARHLGLTHAICTILYIVVAAVLTGMVPYPRARRPRPHRPRRRPDGPGIRLVRHPHQGRRCCGLKLGDADPDIRPNAGLLRHGEGRPVCRTIFSTLHANAFAPPGSALLFLGVRHCHRDGVAPPHRCSRATSSASGTAVAFAIVCISVLWLRRARPDLERPFKAPGGVWTPILGIVGALVMAGPLLADMALSTVHGDPIPGVILVSYIALGAVIYATYGYRNSRLAQGLGQRDSDQDAGPGPMQAEVSGLGDGRAD